MRLAPRQLAGLLLVLLCATLTSEASADEKRACVAASERAQQLRSAGRLGEARAQLTICGRATCPKLVQQDCTHWMIEVLADIPSIVPGAKDRLGHDVVDVRFSIDGKLATETLDGKPISLDPGVHALTFETKGSATLTEQVVIKPGEKNRVVSVNLATLAPSEPPRAGQGPSAAPSPRPEEGPPPPPGKPPVAAYVIGAGGIVAGAAALVLTLQADGDARALRDSGCAPHCNPSEVDGIQQRRTIAGVTAITGGALLVAGVVLFFLHDSGRGSSSAHGTSWLFPRDPAVAGRAGAALRF